MLPYVATMPAALCAAVHVLVVECARTSLSTHTVNWWLWCSYDMYYAKEVGSGDDVELTMFSTICVPFYTAMFTWVYPMLDGEGRENGVIERNLGQGLQVLLLSLLEQLSCSPLELDVPTFG